VRRVSSEFLLQVHRFLVDELLRLMKNNNAQSVPKPNPAWSFRFVISTQDVYQKDLTTFNEIVFELAMERY